MGHAVGHITGLESVALQRMHQLQRGGPGVDEDEVVCLDQPGRRLRDAALLGHGQRLLGRHGRLIGQKAAVRQGGTAVHLVQLAQPVQLGQIAPDGGLASVQRLAQFLHGDGALPFQLLQDQTEAFFCQHLHPLLWSLTP